MLINIPVTISFDDDGRSRLFGKPSNGAVFTLRYDPQNANIAPEISHVWPPKADTKFYPDKDGVIAQFLSDVGDKAVLRNALADPESYYVDQDTAKARLAEMEAEAAA